MARYDMEIKIMIDIGEKIKEELERQERSVSWLAQKLGCHRTVVYRLLGRNSIDTALLRKISSILGHDFFEDYSTDLHAD